MSLCVSVRLKSANVCLCARVHCVPGVRADSQSSPKDAWLQDPKTPEPPQGVGAGSSSVHRQRAGMVGKEYDLCVNVFALQSVQE